jgi:anhydro-N-acetylmuramic acid kinase
MSGTSMDAIDAALVDISNEQIRLIAYRQYPITSELCKELKSVTGHSSIDDVTRLDVRLGRLLAEAASALIQENGLDNSDIAAIGSHGQTILHRPEPPDPTTLQIGDPNLIAHLTGITTVADFRRMDIAAGGQGAPLTPALHNHLFRHAAKNRVIVNIGGMANITILPALDTDSIICGFDTGPGNVLLDEWVNKHTGQPMDTDGCWAASGTSNLKLLEQLLQDDYFYLAPPKSTGRDYFNLNWLQTRLENFNHAVLPKDIQSTLVQLTAITITNAINKYAPSTKEIIVCGGGAHNPQLMQALARNLATCNVISAAHLGINPDALEAIAFAWLARCRIEGQPGNLPAVTGATAPVLLGCIYGP